MIGANGQQVKLVWIDGQHVEVDAEIAAFVAALNSSGFGTVASCSGHGFRPANIALKDGREIIIARSFDEARRIDGLFPDIGGQAPDTARMREAVAAFIAKYDECEPHIQDAFLHRMLRCGDYTGPNYKAELDELRQVLSPHSKDGR